LNGAAQTISKRIPHARHTGRATAALEIDPGPSARIVRRTRFDRSRDTGPAALLPLRPRIAAPLDGPASRMSEGRLNPHHLAGVHDVVGREVQQPNG